MQSVCSSPPMSAQPPKLSPIEACDIPDTNFPTLRAPSSLPVRNMCRIAAHITGEMAMLASHRIQLRRDRRRTLAHVRQIAMYACHVTLQLPLVEIATGFGRDRTTVAHACRVVEDRRDDPAYDDFVSAVERTLGSIFGGQGLEGHE